MNQKSAMGYFCRKKKGFGMLICSGVTENGGSSVGGARVDTLMFSVRRHITTTERLNWGFSLTGRIVCGNHQFNWQVSRSDMSTSAFLF